MFKSIAPIVVFVFLLIPQYSSTAVLIDEPDWKELVENWYLPSPEHAPSTSWIGTNESLRNSDKLWEHQPQDKTSSVASVKYVSHTTLNLSQQNTQMHESVILFCFGTVIIGCIRISKKRKTIFTQDNHQLIAKVGYKP